MTFEQLDYFIATVECKTFFDAAEKMHISQSMLSKQIKKLEKELDVLLWDRSKRQATLTDAGKAFYIEAQNLSLQYHTALQKMESFRSEIPDTFHIGTLPFLSQYHLTEPIRQFIESHPEISILLSEAEEEELMKKFLDYTFDLIIAREMMIDHELYYFYKVAEDTLSVILPGSHPLADRSVLSLKDIKRERFLLMHPYTSIYQLCQQLFLENDMYPQVLRTARVESLISAVQIGEGISLFPESNFRLFRHDDLVSIPLIDAPTLRIGIAYKKNRKMLPILREFQDFLSFKY